MTERRHAPATARNRDAILEVLRRILPSGPATVLEIASGSGEHAIHFAGALPGLTWQPSDPDPGALASIAAWSADSGCRNLRPPLQLDARWDSWPIDQLGAQLDAIFCANMIHIAPWSACVGLLAGAGRHLAPGGLLVLYGPYRIGGVHTAPSNEAFDADLRARDPSWGVRDLEAVVALAAPLGLGLEERVPMPANNQTLIFRRSVPGAKPGKVPAS